ncbi:MAG: ABC transporter substrate-binding protein [Proteobacteria bacterium]|nr:ABC transporter substrate-binding protein [Pseudomonadota bacterium]
MKKESSWFLVSCLFMLMTVMGLADSTLAEEPQYGGTLRISPIYPHIPPVTWDPHDWHWKTNQDVGLVYEHLLVGDLQKGPRGTGEFDFKNDAWIPPSAVRGELAESWRLLEDPLRFEFQLRKEVYWQEKKGIMTSREFVADDVVAFFNGVGKSQKAVPDFWDFVEHWEAQGKYTVVAYLKKYHANWQYRLAWGYYGSILPPEVADAAPHKWKKITGTGPFSLTKYRNSNYTEYERNPTYWDKAIIDGQAYAFPFVDKIRYLLDGNEQSRVSALRSGEIDLLTGIRRRLADELKRDVPHLKWSRWLYNNPVLFAMRMDKEPFYDVRVRRAMALGIDQKEILEFYWGGQAELFAYPYPPSWTDCYVPLEKQPELVRELYTYDPEKAKQLLAEAGYPNGFTVKANVNSSNRAAMDQARLVVGYLGRIGVKLKLVPLEYRRYLSVMVRKRHEAGYFHTSGHENPFKVLRKNFVSGQTWNPYMMIDKEFDQDWQEAVGTIDQEKRKRMLQELATLALERVPFVQLPDPYMYTAWWPWVKNYYGELRVGAERYGPIHARIWIDMKLKEELGY